MPREIALDLIIPTGATPIAVAVIRLITDGPHGLGHLDGGDIVAVTEVRVDSDPDAVVTVELPENASILDPTGTYYVCTIEWPRGYVLAERAFIVPDDAQVTDWNSSSPAELLPATGPIPLGHPGIRVDVSTAVPSTPGPTGADGSAVRHGIGAPASGLGLDGDFYIDTSTGEMYGPKTDGVWGAGYPLVLFTSGSGPPTIDMGVEHQHYLDITGHDLYGPKTGGDWGSPVSLIGPAGPGGAAGPPGTTLHAGLTDLATSGHPAAIVSTDGPAGWVDAQQALDGLHGLIGTLDAAVVAGDATEADARNLAISAAVNALVDGAPGLLNTLGEIAAALGDDADLAATLVTAINTRATQADLDGENSRALAAEGVLGDSINFLSDEVTSFEPGVMAAISTETADRIAADDLEATTARAAEDALTALVGTETAARDAAINALVDGAPGLLDTLGEIAAHLADADDLAAVLVDAVNARATQVALDDETARAVAAEADLYTGEVNRAADALALRQAAEDDLQGAIDGEAVTARAAEAANATAITTEAATRATADSAEVTARNLAISTAIDALINSAPGMLDTLGEIAAAITADETAASALAALVATKASSASLTAEAATARAAESAISTAIATEVTNRGTAVTAEATTARAAESANATAIANEVTNRGTAVTAETTRATAAEGVNATAIATETTNRGTAVTGEAAARSAADSAEVTARYAAITAAINALVNGAPGLLDTLAEIATQLATDETAVGALTTLVNTKATSVALAAEATTARAAESANATAVTNEATTRAAADTTEITARNTAITTALSGLPVGVTVPCAGAASTVVTHNLNTRNVSVEVRRATTPWDSMIAGDLATTLNTVTVPFTVTPAAGDFLITVAPATGSGATGPQGPPGNPGAPPVDVQTFTASGTWTKPTAPVGCGPYAEVDITVVGAGGGAGSGRRGAAGTVRCGGSGGGGGGYTRESIPIALVGATESVVLGTPGVGGAAKTTDDTNGSTGTGATASYFGLWARVSETGPASGGTTAGGTGGYGSTGLQTGTTGASQGSTGGAGVGPGNTLMAAGGGASGGGITSANVASAGGNGSPSQTGGGSGGRGGGVPGAIGANGSAPAFGPAVGEPMGAPGSGSGGSSLTGVGGDGANGVIYGAGGGGGGASVNGFNSGKGGNGAPGIVVVITR